MQALCSGHRGGKTPGLDLWRHEEAVGRGLAAASPQRPRLPCHTIALCPPPWDGPLVESFLRKNAQVSHKQAPFFLKRDSFVAAPSAVPRPPLPPRRTPQDSLRSSLQGCPQLSAVALWASSQGRVFPAPCPAERLVFGECEGAQCSMTGGNPGCASSCPQRLELLSISVCA